MAGNFEQNMEAFTRKRRSEEDARQLERESLWRATRDLDTWLQADELRFAEVLAGELLRWHVRLKTIDFTLAGETEHGRGEAGTLQDAIRQALKEVDPTVS